MSTPRDCLPIHPDLSSLPAPPAISSKKNGRPRRGVHSLGFGDGLPGEFDAGKNAGSFDPNGIQTGWDRGRAPCRMVGATWAVPTSALDCLGLEGRIGQQQNDVGVVMSEAAVLGQLRFAAGVSDADVRGDDDVGRARVYGWVVVVERKRRAVVDLPERDARGGGIVFEDFDAGVGIGGALQPDQRDVIFRRPNAGGVVGGFGVRNIARVREQGDG